MSTGPTANVQDLEYLQYVASVANANDKYEAFARWLHGQAQLELKTDNPFVYIIDSVDRALKFYRYLGHGKSAGRGLADLRSAIENPERDVKTRLLVMDIRKQHLSPELVDTIGVPYNIEPAYFASIAAKHIHPTQNEGPNQVVEIDQSIASFLHLDVIQTPPYPDNHQHLWVKQLEQSTPEHQALTVVLVTVSGSPEGLRELCAGDIKGPKCIQKIARVGPDFIETRATGTTWDAFGGRMIVDALHTLQQEEIESADKMPLQYVAHLLRGILPMCHRPIDNLYARHEEWLSITRAYRTERKDMELYNAWQDGRSCLENLENNLTRLQEYIHHKKQQESDMLKYFLASVSSWLAKSQKIENHVRDELNLHIGVLALEESRKSIEASYQAILQGFSIRRLTVIACMYLPLSLMTSAFGMNLKELGQNGPNLRVFFATTGAMTVFTLLCWGVWVAWRAWSTIKLRLQARYKKEIEDPDFVRRPERWRDGDVPKYYMTWSAVRKELKKDFGPMTPASPLPPSQGPSDKKKIASKSSVRTMSGLV